MLGEGHLRSIVKENLRGVRFLARELKGAVQSADRHNRWLPRPAVSLTNTVAEFSDTALSQLETAALGFLSADPQARAGTRPLRPLAGYFPAAGRKADLTEREALFARDQYAAAKRVLAGKGSTNPSVSEMAFAEAFRRIALGGDVETFALAAATTLALSAVRPVASPALIVDAETGRVRDANQFVAAVLGLALAVASSGDEDVPASEVHHAATAAVDVGWDGVEAAFRAGDRAAAEMERLFRQWAPHLP